VKRARGGGETPARQFDRGGESRGRKHRGVRSKDTAKNPRSSRDQERIEQEDERKRAGGGAEQWGENGFLGGTEGRSRGTR